MTRNGYFGSPFLLGFDHFERLLERTTKSASDGYPPYNIEQIGPDLLRITLAVAGFSLEDLEVVTEENQLVIRGRQTEIAGKTFLHRGIAARQFQRAFVLADGIMITGAELKNGLLSIELARPQTEGITRKIDIMDASAGTPALAEGDRQ
ncbi:MAG: Hsp20 family protein [Alphaproteobacteria bacterium]|nr:Hsp20 family protein [Alphaproteobacteria bacterium]